MVMGRNGMGRNGYGPKWSWAEMVMGRNDPEPIEVISVGMERSNGIPMEIFRLSTIVGCFFMGLLFREHPKAQPGG